MYGLKRDWVFEARPRVLVLEDYAGAEARWCPGCGAHAILAAVQRLARDAQLAPEKTVMVSGIGCSSRFPHYMKTYGFHGLHGRALPVACGIRSRRPDLEIFVLTGDGDCCAIGTSHWIHAIRYNMNLSILLFDNKIYALTKAQTSPTTRIDDRSNTHPRGSPFIPINPISVSLGIPNASFVAQTVDWNPSHLYETLKAAHAHQGTSFVRIFQRCPHYTSSVYDQARRDPSQVLLMMHPQGIPVDDGIAKVYKNQVEHDPENLAEARELADIQDRLMIGLFYRNLNADRYDVTTIRGSKMTSAERILAIELELDRFAI
jgi:2-oxoglutarate ferredoxin oxidoreductase subunit beta